MDGPRAPKQRRSAQAPVPEDIAEKLAQQRTVELGTADLEELEQSGVIGEKLKQTIALTRNDLVELDPNAPTGPEPKVVVALPPAAAAPPSGPASGVVIDDSLTIAELPAQSLGAAVAERDIRTQYVSRISAQRAAVEPPRQRARGRWIVVLVYIAAAAALALSIYYRAIR